MRTGSSTLATPCVLCLTPNLIVAVASTVNLLFGRNPKWAKAGTLSLGWSVDTTDMIISFDTHARQTDVGLSAESGLSFAGQPCLCFNINHPHPPHRRTPHLVCFLLKIFACDGKPPLTQSFMSRLVICKSDDTHSNTIKPSSEGPRWSLKWGQLTATNAELDTHTPNKGKLRNKKLGTPWGATNKKKERVNGQLAVSCRWVWSVFAIPVPNCLRERVTRRPTWTSLEWSSRRLASIMAIAATTTCSWLAKSAMMTLRQVARWLEHYHLPSLPFGMRDATARPFIDGLLRRSAESILNQGRKGKLIASSTTTDDILIVHLREAAKYIFYLIYIAMDPKTVTADVGVNQLQNPSSRRFRVDRCSLSVVFVGRDVEESHIQL